MRTSTYVVIPNWNGAKDLPKAIDSVLDQTLEDLKLIIVDNGSVDNSKDVMEYYMEKDSRVSAIYRDKNYGYTGGVNPGFELAIEEGARFVAPFNNDAVADKNWLKQLVDSLEKYPTTGIATCKLLHADGKTFDSTGDIYTSWGTSYPRGRDEKVSDKYDKQTEIFGASGGASLYRVEMLKQIGIFDQDFFAYYEDVDLSFRAQLADWKVSYVPNSVVYHEQGKTSNRMASGFTTTQFMKNLPIIIVKDLPLKLWPVVVPRFILAYSFFFANAFLQHRGWAACKGTSRALVLLPKKLRERRTIQKSRKVSVDYIWSIIEHDLPPNSYKLRKLRSFWWKLTFKSSGNK